MDNQGFTANGSTIDNGMKTAAALAHPGAAGLLPLNKTKIALNDVVGVLHSASKPEPDAEERKIATLHKIRSGSDVFMGEFFGMLAGGALGWATRAVNKSQAGTVVHAIFTAPFEAMRHTKLNNLAEFPANYMSSIADHANKAARSAVEKSIRNAYKNKLPNSEIDKLIAATNFETFDYSSVKGTGSKKWAAGASSKAESLKVSGQEFAASVGNIFSPVTEPVGGAVRSALGSFENTGLGKRIHGGMQNLVDGRIERKVAQYTKHIDSAHAGLTQEMPGFWKKIGNFFTGGMPKEIGDHPLLNDVATHLGNARSATSAAERVKHTDAAVEALKTLQSAEGSVKTRVTFLAEALEKSGSAAKALQGLEAAKGSGLASTLKALTKAGGKLPLFGTLLGVSAAAGVSAVLYQHHHDASLSKQAHAEITNAIGADTPLMQNIERAYEGEKYKHFAKSSFEVVGEVANAAMGAVHGGGGGAMMGAVMLPMAGTMLIKDNPLLNAYANLRQQEKTGKALSPEEKLEAVRQLVASVPSVEAHGGYYNRLTLPVSEAILDKNLSAIETIKLLANEAQFTGLAADVQQKQKAAVAPAPQVPVEEPVKGVADTTVPLSQLAMPHLSTGTALAANSVQHEGRMLETQRTTGL